MVTPSTLFFCTDTLILLLWSLMQIGWWLESGLYEYCEMYVYDITFIKSHYSMYIYICIYIYIYMHTHLNMYTFSTYIHNSSIFPHPNKPCWRKTELHCFPPHFLWVSSMGWICKWLGAWSHHPNMVHWTLPCSSHFSSNSPAWLPNRQRKYALEHSRGKGFYVSGVLWIFPFFFFSSLNFIIRMFISMIFQRIGTTDSLSG